MAAGRQVRGSSAPSEVRGPPGRKNAAGGGRLRKAHLGYGQRTRAGSDFASPIGWPPSAPARIWGSSF